MNKFKKVYIEITNICNLSCSFCPKTNRVKKFLSIEEFKMILNEIKPYTKFIYFHLMGEPLLNPNLEEFLKLSYEEGFKVNITTNGTLIPKVYDILLKSKGLRQVNISLHSFEANDKEVSFNEYFKGILEFIKEANMNTDIICSMRLWNMDSSILSIKGENNLNIDIIEKISQELGYTGDLKENLYRDNKVKIKDRVYLNGAEKFQWPNMHAEFFGDIGFCHGLRDHFGILVDGTVVPCCLDGEGHIPLGNIYSKTLKDILECDRARKIYDGFSGRKRVEELCMRCGYSEIFK
ncbi:radical SAM protein [Clostridium sp. SHJSY1]|uniref:radical SAM/SPASM domain-containing protein n=1 Tax=Clostridium sp. SHJSY1 TaxID=2942483 RepID=UPI002876A9CB|nr:radical SAM/SPASM domain-containing protein [Clostridium sp. SHJSY1]MDS0524602.1 radical SAM protein [Clostridium sp. SHJSY1]